MRKKLSNFHFRCATKRSLNVMLHASSIWSTTSYTTLESSTREALELGPLCGLTSSSGMHLHNYSESGIVNLFDFERKILSRLAWLQLWPSKYFFSRELLLTLQLSLRFELDLLATSWAADSILRWLRKTTTFFMGWPKVIQIWLGNDLNWFVKSP